MRIDITYGLEHLEVTIPEESRIVVRRQPPAPALADPAAAVRQALEDPLGFPALRRALTPDDHVAVVVDEKLPRLAELLTPILEHITEAHVAPEAITLLCPCSAEQAWLDDLPDAFQDVHVEIHDPTDRRKLSYLTTTKQGRRLYLNRTVVDADQVVVLTGLGYDPVLGYGGATGALYPALSDEATRQDLCSRVSLAVPGKVHWPVLKEAEEVAWLLGAPFFVQVIEGAGDEIIHVVGGLSDSSNAAQRLLDARWRETVGHSADLVIASIGGDPARHDFADLSRALANAARVVRPRGRIVLLSQATPRLGPAAALLRKAEEPGQALEWLRQQKPFDMGAAFQWASAAQQATVFLHSGLPGETAEELFAVPVEHAEQVQRLLDEGGSCLFLADAHKAMAGLGEANEAAPDILAASR